jgi:hypothetical protein
MAVIPVSVSGERGIIIAAEAINVGAAEGCDLLIFGSFMDAQNQDQKIAAFGSSYSGVLFCGQ